MRKEEEADPAKRITTERKSTPDRFTLKRKVREWMSEPKKENGKLGMEWQMT